MLETRTHNLEEGKKTHTHQKNQWLPLSHKEQSRVRNSFPVIFWYFSGFFQQSTQLCGWRGQCLSTLPFIHCIQTGDSTPTVWGAHGFAATSLTSAAEETQVVLSDLSATFKPEATGLCFCFCLSKTPAAFPARARGYGVQGSVYAACQYPNSFHSYWCDHMRRRRRGCDNQKIKIKI